MHFSPQGHSLSLFLVQVLFFLISFLAVTSCVTSLRVSMLVMMFVVHISSVWNSDSLKGRSDNFLLAVECGDWPVVPKRRWRWAITPVLSLYVREVSEQACQFRHLRDSDRPRTATSFFSFFKRLLQAWKWTRYVADEWNGSHTQAVCLPSGRRRRAIRRREEKKP